MNNIKLNGLYKHYKNGNLYTVVDFCKIQVNDVWIDAVIYTDSRSKYVRDVKEFMGKFSKVRYG